MKVLTLLKHRELCVRSSISVWEAGTYRHDGKDTVPCLPLNKTTLLTWVTWDHSLSLCSFLSSLVIQLKQMESSPNVVLYRKADWICGYCVLNQNIQKLGKLGYSNNFIFPAHGRITSCGTHGLITLS